MSLPAVLQALELLDSATVTGEEVAATIRAAGVTDVQVKQVVGKDGSTDFLRITVPGTEGRLAGGQAPTLGIIGRLGGIGARPEKIGRVADGDGAVAGAAAPVQRE